MTKHPEFIACVDWRRDKNNKFTTKALDQTDLFGAMSYLEECVRKRPHEAYAITLFAKTGEKKKGKPLYQATLICRVAGLADDLLGHLSWRLRSEKDGEAEWGTGVWVPTDNERHGYFEMTDGSYIG